MSTKPEIPFITEEDRTQQISDIFADICRVYGVPATPPLYLSMATSSSVLAGTWKLSLDIMNHGVLPEVLKQLIFLAVSSARKCVYCELVYSALCKVAGTPDAQIRAAVEDVDSMAPERTQKIIRFAIKAAIASHSLEDADYAVLREEGLSDEELLEVIAVAAAASYFNILADGMKVEIDETIRSILASE